MTPNPPANRRPSLVVDLYELTMAASYIVEGLAQQQASFEVACRSLPEGWGYLLAAGLDTLLDTLERFSFDDATLSFLDHTGLFEGAFLAGLADFRFRGEVRAMAEGTVFFPNEPLVEVTGSLLETQLVETVVLNQLQFPSLVAAKAARCVDAAEGRPLADFSLRRTQGTDAGLHVARGSYLAGFASTSNVAAGSRFGIPVSGTMAHAYVEAFAVEEAAFEAFVRSYPRGATLLIDTYDTLEGARVAARVFRALLERGGTVGAVRLDSGDLAELSKRVRVIFDEAGLPDVSIVASGNLDEHAIARLLALGAPIDGFGVGSRLGVSADAPYLDLAYKLVCFDGRPVMKLSPGKRTLPGRKQVWRAVEDGQLAGDLVSLWDEPAPAGSVGLLEPVMSGGRPRAPVGLEAARERAARQRAALPAEQRQLESDAYRVEVSPQLARLVERVEDELGARRRPPPA